MNPLLHCSQPGGQPDFPSEHPAECCRTLGNKEILRFQRLPGNYSYTRLVDTSTDLLQMPKETLVGTAGLGWTLSSVYVHVCVHMGRMHVCELKGSFQPTAMSPGHSTDWLHIFSARQMYNTPRRRPERTASLPQPTQSYETHLDPH